MAVRVYFRSLQISIENAEGLTFAELRKRLRILVRIPDCAIVRLDGARSHDGQTVSANSEVLFLIKVDWSLDGVSPN